MADTDDDPPELEAAPRRPLVHRDPRRLQPFERNARTHSPAQVLQLRASYREWGFTNPLLIDERDRVIAGHGRLLMALAEGLAEVPCVVLAGLSDAQVRALVIADNKLALNAGWDDEKLAAELAELAGLDFDLSTIGFSDAELAGLLASAGGLTDPDDVPDTPLRPVSVAGDTWLLGRHRLRCGSSTDAGDVALLLSGVAPHLLVTDPPYGVEYDAAWRNDAVRANGRSVGARAVGRVENDDKADWTEAWKLFPGDVAYVWHGGLHAGVVADSLAASGFEIRAQIIWAKNNIAISRGHYHWQHEPCWYAVRQKATGHWGGDRKQSTLWQIDKPLKSETGHSTQKPVECMRRPIENNSSPGQAVYEPFNGSGTTVIAAEMTGRTCFAMELSPAYVDVAVHRWQGFTGQLATHEETGLGLAEIADGRGVALPPTVPLKVRAA